MIQPFSIHYYRKPNNENSFTGKYVLEKVEGTKIPELIHTLIRKPDSGKKIIRVREDKKNRGQLCLSNDSLHKLHPMKLAPKSQHITKLSGSYITKTNLRLYGDIRVVNYPILVELSTDKSTGDKLIRVMTFEGGSELAKTIYDKWVAGSIKESTPDNNIVFSTENVFNEVQHD